MKPITKQKTVDHLPSQIETDGKMECVKVGNQWVNIGVRGNEPTTKGMVKTVIGALMLVVLGYGCMVVFLAL